MRKSKKTVKKSFKGEKLYLIWTPEYGYYWAPPTSTPDEQRCVIEVDKLKNAEIRCVRVEKFETIEPKRRG